MSSKRQKSVSQVGTGWALHHGRLDDRASQSHHALKICLASDRNIMIHFDESTVWTSAVLVGSGVRHVMRNDKELTCSLYFDPDWDFATTLVNLCGDRGIVSLSGAVERAARKCTRHIVGSGAGPQQAFDEFSTCLGSPKTGRASDPRIIAALAELVDCHPEQWPRAGLARTAGLSPERFAALFKESTGLPVRAYVRWLRIQTALRALAAGEDRVSAAKAAGYSSSTLFMNRFRHMFGASPLLFAATLRTKIRISRPY